MTKRLTKSLGDKKIAGVCSGVAKYFGIDPTVVRIAWVLLVLLFGVGIFLYLVCCLLMPDDSSI